MPEALTQAGMLPASKQVLTKNLFMTLNSQQPIHSLKEVPVERLNQIFAELTSEERIEQLYRYFPVHEVLYTSSFGAKSVLMLYLVSQICPEQLVHFIDTTYHFEETLQYKRQLAQAFGLSVIDLRPETKQNALTREEAWWKKHPRMCCTINKVAPLEPMKAHHRIWMSGLMSWQTPFRSRLQVFEQQGDIIKFHPLIDKTESEFEAYLERLDLPRHPLEGEGYGSVGCVHCTRRGTGRTGRWQGTQQTECGLHPGFFVNKQKQKSGG